MAATNVLIPGNELTLTQTLWSAGCVCRCPPRRTSSGRCWSVYEPRRRSCSRAGGIRPGVRKSDGRIQPEAGSWRVVAVEVRPRCDRGRRAIHRWVWALGSQRRGCHASDAPNALRCRPARCDDVGDRDQRARGDSPCRDVASGRAGHACRSIVGDSRGIASPVSGPTGDAAGSAPRRPRHPSASHISHAWLVELANFCRRSGASRSSDLQTAGRSQWRSSGVCSRWQRCSCSSSRVEPLPLNRV